MSFSLSIQAEAQSGTSVQEQDNEKPQVVEAVAVDNASQAPEEIPTGWTTLRMKNDGEEHHFASLSLLPERRTFDEYMIEVVSGINEVWYSIRSGEVDKREAVRPHFMHGMMQQFSVNR